MNNKITLDLSNCKYLGEIHQRIKEAFDFPNFYGENWDAFEDLLWSNCSAEIIEISGENTLSKELFAEINILHSILADAKSERLSKGLSFEFKVIN
ncbi:MAG: barstar family protein [Clostridia bacterium]|nr:barstar family protein [Clostridia bacterium]